MFILEPSNLALTLKIKAIGRMLIVFWYVSPDSSICLHKFQALLDGKIFYRVILYKNGWHEFSKFATYVMVTVESHLNSLQMTSLNLIRPKFSFGKYHWKMRKGFQCYYLGTNIERIRINTDSIQGMRIFLVFFFLISE